MHAIKISIFSNFCVLIILKFCAHHVYVGTLLKRPAHRVPQRCFTSFIKHFCELSRIRYVGFASPQLFEDFAFAKQFQTLTWISVIEIYHKNTRAFKLDCEFTTRVTKPTYVADAVRANIHDTRNSLPIQYHC